MLDKYFYLNLNDQIDEAIKTSLDFVEIDDDDMPVGVTHVVHDGAMLMSFIVTVGELAEVGLVASDVPRLTVI